MRYNKYFLPILILVLITMFSCKQDKSENAKANKSEITGIRDSEEFKEYFKRFFTLSDDNTKIDLPYVNKFMQDNKLFPFKNICDLVDNEIVKSDERILKYWNTRCDFQRTRNGLMRKFQIDGDSIKVLMEEAIDELRSK